MIVPILNGVEVIGAIACSARQKNRFTEQDVRLLALIASNTAQAIERLRLLQDTQRRVDELSILYQVAQLASDATDEDDLLQQVTDVIRQTLYSDEFGFVLLNNEKDGLLPHASYHADLEADLSEKTTLDPNSVIGQVFTTQDPSTHLGHFAALKLRMHLRRACDLSSAPPLSLTARFWASSTPKASTSTFSPSRTNSFC